MNRVARKTVGALVLVLGCAAAPVYAQIGIRAGGVAAMAEHRVNAGHGVEQASGTLLGAEGTLRLGSRMELFVHAAGGQLKADSALADDRDVAETELRAAVLTVPWLALHAGVSARSYTTTLARQRWVAVRFGGEVRLAFVGGGVTGILRAELLPAVSVSGLERPNRAYAAAAGLEYRVGAIAVGLRYALERFDFPMVAGVARAEQMSSLTLHAGIELGGR